jgi:hypothetical protein
VDAEHPHQGIVSWKGRFRHLESLELLSSEMPGQAYGPDGIDRLLPWSGYTKEKCGEGGQQ